MKPEVPSYLRPWLTSNVPLLTFFSRTWMLIIFMVLSNYAVLSKHIWYWVQLPAARDGTPGDWQGITLYDMMGAILYIPALMSIVMVLYLLFIHLYFRGTIDKDAHDGTYITDWAALTSYERVLISTVVRVGFLIAFCILCSSLAKG